MEAAYTYSKYPKIANLERPLWVVSGPSQLYHPNVRFRGQSGRSFRLENDILTGSFRPEANIEKQSRRDGQGHYISSARRD